MMAAEHDGSGADARPFKGLAVFDLATPAFLENRVFDLQYAQQFPGADAISTLAATLRERGVRTITADVYLGGVDFVGPVVLVTEERTPFTSRLLQDSRVRPVACFCLESPIVARAFYQSIPDVSTLFDHVFLWPGTRDRATGGAVFHDVSWPYPGSGRSAQTQPWAERRFLVMVSSNKRAFAWPHPIFDLRHPRSAVRGLLEGLSVARLRRSDPWFRTELYIDRLRAIEYFAKRPEFDLYGRGWLSGGSALSRRRARAVARAYRGEIAPLAKIDVLGKYKFSLCYENTSFPGYITEKIFDCFAAGCIPIYLGAPDAAEAIPPDCFIDARRFRDLHSLERFLWSVNAQAAQRYIEAAAEFIHSPRGVRFTQASFVSSIASVLLDPLE
jgi:hypothetical protein